MCDGNFVIQPRRTQQLSRNIGALFCLWMFRVFKSVGATNFKQLCNENIRFHNIRINCKNQCISPSITEFRSGAGTGKDRRTNGISCRILLDAQAQELFTANIKEGQASGYYEECNLQLSLPASISLCEAGRSFTEKRSRLWSQVGFLE